MFDHGQIEFFFAGVGKVLGNNEDDETRLR